MYNPHWVGNGRRCLVGIDILIENARGVIGKVFECADGVFGGGNRGCGISSGLEKSLLRESLSVSLLKTLKSRSGTYLWV